LKLLEITDVKNGQRHNIYERKQTKIALKNGHFWEAKKIVRVGDYLFGSVGIPKTHPFFVWPYNKIHYEKYRETTAMDSLAVIYTDDPKSNAKCGSCLYHMFIKSGHSRNKGTPAILQKLKQTIPRYNMSPSKTGV